MESITPPDHPMFHTLRPYFSKDCYRK